ncbi:hypothetical protein [Pedobacter agri]|uniref:hypothetical protein n=1 Tax=Pedobacter agri TaxID=454586 RepID=UPI00277DF841|nr:hypothetical protein [Pedobacter agri]MDQ1138637.1 hypothetical protein [Pedobacter agri]
MHNLPQNVKHNVIGMIVPVKNLVETVDLTAEDIFLPMLECVVNAIISLQQSQIENSEKKNSD